MIAQISFTADADLKNKALEKAKNEGITLKALLIYAMKGFVDGKLSFSIIVRQNQIDEPEVEELFFDDKDIQDKATKLAKILK